MTDMAGTDGGNGQPRVLLVYYTYTGQARKVLLSLIHI